jgi:hypothetical protein
MVPLPIVHRYPLAGLEPSEADLLVEQARRMAPGSHPVKPSTGAQVEHLFGKHAINRVQK